jgi:hypothetical protein
MNTTPNISPPLQVSQWLNSPKPVTLESLYGKVVVLHTFQMLCPGCVSHGLPQALRIHRLSPLDRVAVSTRARSVVQRDSLYGSALVTAVASIACSSASALSIEL